MTERKSTKGRTVIYKTLTPHDYFSSPRDVGQQNKYRKDEFDRLHVPFLNLFHKIR